MASHGEVDKVKGLDSISILDNWSVDSMNLDAMILWLPWVTIIVVTMVTFWKSFVFRIFFCPLEFTMVTILLGETPKLLEAPFWSKKKVTFQGQSSQRRGSVLPGSVFSSHLCGSYQEAVLSISCPEDNWIYPSFLSSKKKNQSIYICIDWCIGGMGGELHM